MPSRTLASRRWYCTPLCLRSPTAEDLPLRARGTGRGAPGRVLGSRPRSPHRDEENPCRRIPAGGDPETHGATGSGTARLERLSPGWAPPSHLTRRRWAAPRVTWMRRRRGTDSRYRVSRPHADTLTSHRLVRDPDGGFLIMIKKKKKNPKNIGTMIDRLRKGLVKYTDTNCSLRRQGEP